MMKDAYPIRAAKPLYVGRFAPSPSGPLHAGSLVTAMASYLDARAHHGCWLLRIEDIDEPRTVPGADQAILRQLKALGMHWDKPPIWQTQRHLLYKRAFVRLRAAGRAYRCSCTRRALPPGPYPGTCRPLVHTQTRHTATHASACSWRFRVDPGLETFIDGWQGPQSQDVAAEVGDFIIRRADGLWAYQLAAVVDDGEQHITDIVRGADLLDSTARQRQLARALGLPPPRVLHVPLILDTSGHKLSKQNHAPALDTSRPLDCLLSAWKGLGFADPGISRLETFWPAATAYWARRFGPESSLSA